jgi:hypothetical protein
MTEKEELFALYAELDMEITLLEKKNGISTYKIKTLANTYFYLSFDVNGKKVETIA